MPIYEYMCRDCGRVFDKYHKMEGAPKIEGCIECGADAVKVLSSRYGILSDTPSWLNDHVRSVLQKEGERPIQTRKEHDEYLKRNNIVQIG